jgi:hypothetical protein
MDFSFYNFRGVFESSKEHLDFLQDLSEFLEREKIYGYEQDILSILKGEPSTEVMNDLRKSFARYDGIKPNDSDIQMMDRKMMLERFLDYKGIKSYTEPILDLWGQYRKEGKSKIIEIKGKELFHLKPSKDTLRIWTWDNPKLSGVPVLKTVKSLYGVDNFFQVNPSSYRYSKK